MKVVVGEKGGKKGMTKDEFRTRDVFKSIKLDSPAARTNCVRHNVKRTGMERTVFCKSLIVFSSKIRRK